MHIILLTCATALFFYACKKDNLLITFADRSSLKVEGKTLLSKNAIDLTSRLDVIKDEFYKRKLDKNLYQKMIKV